MATQKWCELTRIVANTKIYFGGGCQNFKKCDSALILLTVLVLKRRPCLGSPAGSLCVRAARCPGPRVDDGCPANVQGIPTAGGALVWWELADCAANPVHP